MTKIQCVRCSMEPDEYLSFPCGHSYCIICLSYLYLQCINDEVIFIT